MAAKTSTGDAHEGSGDASLTLADHLARTAFSDLPAVVVKAAKYSILDMLGCILAGTSASDVEAIDAMVRRWSGAPICTVIGSRGLKLPPHSAALVNGAAIHQHDFDDVHDSVTCHPTASSFVPALAAAEERGGASGADLILAVALGSDVTSRVSRAISGAHGHPWYRAPVVGMFGATAAAAKMLGASAEQIVEAFGLALPQIGGTYASLLHHGSSVRSIRDGLAYKNGLLAAELAMAGVRGDPEVFDGKFGFYQAYYKGAYDRARLLADLGVDYETARVSLKPWPSARHLHTTLTAVLKIMEENRLAFEDIEDVVFEVGRVNVERCQPATPEVQRNHIDLLSNLPYSVAAAIRFGAIPPSAYLDPAKIRDVVDHALPKVRWRQEARQDGPWRFEPGRVEIRVRDGRTLTAECLTALGHPDNPMSEAQIVEKFGACAGLARRPLASGDVAAIVDLVLGLERARDLSPLLKLVG